MTFISMYRKTVNLAGVINNARDAYQGAKDNLADGLSLLRAILIVLPGKEVVFILIDRVETLQGPRAEKESLLRVLVKLVGETRPRLNVKLFVTNTGEYPDDLGKGNVSYRRMISRPTEDLGGPVVAPNIIGYKMDITGWINIMQIVSAS